MSDISKCIFCGTEIEDGFCVECSETANELELEYEDLVSGIGVVYEPNPIENDDD